jgi:hypothetical protein
MKLNKLSYYFFFIFLINSNIIFCQNNIVNLNNGGVNIENYFVKIPYKEINGKIIIEVNINNKGYKFIIDTGAPTIITEKLKKEINPNVIGNIEIIDQSGIKDNVEVVNLFEINIGNLSFNSIPTIVTNDSKILFDCFEVDGYIGSNLLRNSTLQINAKEKHIIICDNIEILKIQNKNSKEILLSHSQSNPFVEIELKKGKKTIKEKVLIDTGDNGFYQIAFSTLEQIKNHKVINFISNSIGSNSFGFNGKSKDENNFIINIPILNIINLELKNVKSKTTYAESSRIGSEILNLGILTIDYKNKKINLEPFDEPIETINDNVWQIDAVINKEKLVVGVIWDYDLKNKINIGDEIISIDSVIIEGMDICQLLKSNFKIKKDKVVLVLKDLKTSLIKTIEINKM